MKKKLPAILALAVVLLATLPFAAAKLWNRLEQGAYRSPLSSAREMLTPRERRLLELAAIGASQEDSAVGEHPVASLGPEHPGAALFEANGCYACHSLQGERKIGPSLLGIFGESVEFSDGTQLTIDEEYIVESILKPDVRQVAGFEEAAMPSYEGLVSAEEARILADYIISLE